MIAYSTLGTSDTEKSIAFYDEVLGAIGAVRELTSPNWTQYGRKRDKSKVCLTWPYNGNPATSGNGAMLAFEAKNHTSVDRFHEAALKLGGADEGRPGVREGTHYVAYVRDPDGNKLCAFAPK